MEDANAFITIANIHVRDRNYDVHVSMNLATRCLHVFKYDTERVTCAYEVFDCYLDACDYLELLL
jgi:predicted transcriptional regulator YheO